MKDTCFVIMPIGTQRFGFGEISAQDLRGRYTDLIREAVLRARPTIEILRADDIAAPGGITTDIFTALMESRYVVADVTFPNPNVFYELGIRHACRTGTVLLRERRPEAVPFDIFDLRHIEYENTPTGLKMLAERMCEYFDWLDTNPEKPDNRFLELALLKHYEFQSSTKVRRLASIKEKLAEGWPGSCHYSGGHSGAYGRTDGGNNE